MIGLLLRTIGLLFNGMDDLDEMIIKWGSGVHQLGLGMAFKENYGVFSYAVFGVSELLAEFVPRFWWAPYKAVELAFEIGILVLLLNLVPSIYSRLVLSLYWLNPWFILHGAWHGFWDAPHTFCALLGVWFLKSLPNRELSWFVVGVLFMIAGMFKPQGLIYFVIPQGIYLGLRYCVTKSNSLVWYGLGCLLVIVLTAGILLLTGGNIWAIPKNYFSVVTVMPNLCNDCVNIWRPLTRALQEFSGQMGPTYTEWLPEWLLTGLHFSSLILVGSAIGVFSLHVLRQQGYGLEDHALRRMTRALELLGILFLIAFIAGLFHASSGDHSWLAFGRYSLKAVVGLAYLLSIGIAILLGAPVLVRIGYRVIGERQSSPGTGFGDDKDEYRAVFLLIVFAALLIPQIGTKAFLNHSYAGLVLLIPLAASGGRMFVMWLATIGIAFYAHLSEFVLGRPMVLPKDFLEYPPAQLLVSKIAAYASSATADSLLRFQRMVDGALRSYLPNEPLISILSLVTFACAVVVVWDMFRFTGKWANALK